MAELTINISAKVRQALKAIDALERELEQSEDQAKRTTKAVQRVGTKGVAPIQKLGKVTKVNATPALQEFSRVIQDAPFGIQGVANNIQQLTANFGSLSKSAGGVKAALSAMLGTLAGPAGILLVVSAVTSLFVAFGDRLKTTKNEAKKLTEELEKINKRYGAAVDLNESQEKLLEAQGKSTITIRQQRIAILGAQIASLQAVQQQNEALLTTIKLQQETVTLWEGLAGFLQTGFGNIIRDIKRDLGFVFGIASVLAEKTAETTGLQEKLAKFAKEDKKEKEKIADLTAQVQAGQASINNLMAEALELAKGITQEREKQNKLNLEGLIPGRNILSGLFAQTNFSFGQAVVEPIKNAVKFVKPQLANLEQALVDFNTNASNIIRGAIANTFAGLGEAIGNAIATGGNVIQAAGISLLSSLGSILVQLGKMAISIGIGLQKIKIALKSLNPVVAIAAGTALVALGSFFKGKSRQLASNFGSGGVGGQGGGGNFVTGTTGSFTGSSGFGDGKVVFEIAGTKLVGVLSRTLSRNQRLGNNIVIG